MELAGNKVILREIRQQDEEMIKNLIDDPKTGKVTGGYPRPISFDHQIRWFHASDDPFGGLRCVIADREYPEKGLGVILLFPEEPERRTGEIYIKLLRSARGRGYGQDAVNTAVFYGFHHMGLGVICSSILENNRASRRLFEKCGFKEEGVRKSGHPGEERHVLSYAIKKKTV